MLVFHEFSLNVSFFLQGHYGLACDRPLILADSVTAVAFSPIKLTNGSYMIAAGLETGGLVLVSWSEDNGWETLKTIGQNMAHHKTIKRLKFCPGSKNLPISAFFITQFLFLLDHSSALLLATCGEDNFVKLFSFDGSYFSK